MNQLKLNEWCKARNFRYGIIRNGPDHCPQFTAVVEVNGQCFESPSILCICSKNAQELGAQMASQYFVHRCSSSSQQPPSTSDAHAQALVPIPPLEMNYQDNDALHIYKNPLQQYAGKRSLNMPVYAYKTEGLLHALRYKSRVSLDGKIYEAPDFFPSIKDAEKAAAKVACQAPSIDETHEDKGLYKNFLQAMAQKRGLKLPSYETSLAGSSDEIGFVSTMVVGSDTFRRTEARTKMQAEANAAEVAYIALTQNALHIYKNMLEQYAGKRSLNKPVYAYKTEGLLHALRYKSRVSLDGKICEAPNFFSSIKDAENAAAKVACQALSIDETHEDKGLYKIFLQAMAQKRGLKLPSYETSLAKSSDEIGFVSTVVVGSDTFRRTEARTKMQAEANAAEVAYIALMLNALHIYKNMLQQYAGKRSLNMSVYAYKTEGLLHALRYKSRVSLDGKIYEAPNFFSSIKDAENAAAKVACQALSIDETHEDKGLYKIFLQAMAQKRGLKLPSYETSLAGSSDEIGFVSTVVVGSDTFRRTEARTKMQAEAMLLKWLTLLLHRVRN